jgi:hypothetical protein
LPSRLLHYTFFTFFQHILFDIVTVPMIFFRDVMIDDVGLFSILTDVPCRKI